MPTWNIHLAMAKKINEKLKNDEDAFYLGNVLPDIDYGMKLTKKITHNLGVTCPKCPKEILPDYKDFIKKNKGKMNNPIIMGEYIHLLTDYYFNKTVFQNHWILDDNKNIIGIKLKNGKCIISQDDKTRKKYKHKDFDTYSKYLNKEGLVDIPNFSNTLKDYIKDTKYDIKYVKNRCEFLNGDYLLRNKYTLKEKIFGLKYKMISHEELDNMFNECYKFIMKELEQVLK